MAQFNSTKWCFSTDKNGLDITKVDGMLTLHGKTNLITLIATKFNCYLIPILNKSIFEGKFKTTIDRRQWGISKYTLLGMTERLN